MNMPTIRTCPAGEKAPQGWQLDRPAGVASGLEATLTRIRVRTSSPTEWSRTRASCGIVGWPCLTIIRTSRWIRSSLCRFTYTGLSFCSARMVWTMYKRTPRGRVSHPNAAPLTARNDRACSVRNRDIRRRSSRCGSATGRDCTGRGASRRNVCLCPGSPRSTSKTPRRRSRRG